MNNIEKYKFILFSFIYRDEEYPSVKKNKGFSIKKIIKVFIDVFKEEFKVSFSKSQEKLHGKIWLFVDSDNQFKALRPVGKMRNTVFVSSTNSLIFNFSDENIVHLKLKSKLKYRLRGFLRLGDYKRIFKRKFKDHLATIIKYDGIYESLLEELSKNRPSAIILSNDHNAYCRALIMVARELKIKTVYLQHAAVTDRFPSLEFDLSLLDGQDSLDKYKKAGEVKGIVKLVGMPKFDEYFHLINKKKNVESIGLALNNGDDFDVYFKVFSELNKNFDKIKYHIRFHPSIDVSKINIPDFFKISHTNKESSFEFLTRIDTLFSGNSSIHLEAVLMNVPSFQLKNEKDLLQDYYGFVQNKLIEEIDLNDLFGLIEGIIKRKPEVRHRAKYYNAVIGTKYDGFSIKKVRNEILSLLKN